MSSLTSIQAFCKTVIEFVLVIFIRKDLGWLETIKITPEVQAWRDTCKNCHFVTHSPDFDRPNLEFCIVLLCTMVHSICN